MTPSRTPVTARGTIKGDNSAIYELLRHLFTHAQSSSVSDKYWHLYGCFTDERHVMTEYESKDGSRIRADSTGERDEGYRLPDHEFTFYPAPIPDAPEIA
jgi:hypothetical protein